MPSKSSNLLASGPLSLIGIILLAALSRLLPHPPNFSPVEAVALFGGAYFAQRMTAMLGAAGGDVRLRPRPGPDQRRQLLRVFPERRLLAGLSLHRTVDGAWLRPARPGHRHARARLFAGSARCCSSWSPISAPGSARPSTRQTGAGLVAALCRRHSRSSRARCSARCSIRRCCSAASRCCAGASRRCALQTA